MSKKSADAAPKKKVVKKESSVLKGNEDDKLLLLRQSEILKHRLSLQENLVYESELSMKDSRKNLLELKKSFEEEKNSHFEIISDMTRQYKSMREDLLKKIAELEDNARRHKEQIEAIQKSKDELERSKNQIIDLKTAEIAEYKQKMDDMALEFSHMLKSTLDKMTEKINQTNLNLIN